VRRRSRSTRGLIPAAIAGAWAGVLAHRYLGYLATALHAWTRNSAFDLVTSTAIGAALFLVTRSIIRQPEPRIPPARVPHWLPRLGFRTLGLLAVISTLLQVERAVTRLPAPPSKELSDAEPIIDETPEPVPAAPDRACVRGVDCQTVW